jgi:hypothetical protein
MIVLDKGVGYASRGETFYLVGFHEKTALIIIDIRLN